VVVEKVQFDVNQYPTKSHSECCALAQCIEEGLSGEDILIE